MMLSPQPPLGPVVPRGGAALCVCLASRGLTVLWKVCFVNISLFFFFLSLFLCVFFFSSCFFSVSDSRRDGERRELPTP